MTQKKVAVLDGEMTMTIEEMFESWEKVAKEEKKENEEK